MALLATVDPLILNRLQLSLLNPLNFSASTKEFQERNPTGISGSLQVVSNCRVNGLHPA